MSDTHLTGSIDRLPSCVVDAARRADLVLHAGDILDVAVLDDLARFAPVTAVRGNNDRGAALDLPETIELDLDGVVVAMVHDSGPSTGRARRMRRRFPGADIVVFGHSHIPIDEIGVDGQRLFNPGSPTLRRREAHCSYGWLTLAAGAVVDHRIVRIGQPSAASTGGSGAAASSDSVIADR